MASALKRKRGLVEVADTPKRAKSIKESHNSLPTPQLSQSGWDAAFNPPTKTKELVKTNGVNGDAHRETESPDAVDFEEFVEQSTQLEEEEQRRRKELKSQQRREKKLLKSVTQKTPDVWKLSEPIGGRMINVDPVFSADERFLILANPSTLHVYSTSDSLLVRSIKLKVEPSSHPNSRIITYCLSPTDPNLVWVARSDGTIYGINWTTGAGADQSWRISSTGCIHMTVASMESAGRRRDVVFTTEMKKDRGWRITANELAWPGSPIETAVRTIYTSNQRINYLKTAMEGAVIVAASENRILVGSLRSPDFSTVDKIKYEILVFESSDFISSLDIKAHARSERTPSKKKRVIPIPVVDVAVGDVKGSIFLHNDLLGNLHARASERAAGISLVPRKFHWHRQAVNTVKFSLDGNYMISGGTETVLSLWQLDTGRQQFLPHMAATIQNLVVSRSGTSYGIQLADNSAMVLSVAELMPTANMAGIQACVLKFEDSPDSTVWRIEQDLREANLVQRTPAAISSRDPSHLLLGVGQMQEINHSRPLMTSVPFLQTFDLRSGHSLYRQSLTRSNVTNKNMAPNEHRISEPRVTHMQLSFDGNWLATVDEWTPPKRDMDFIGHQGMDLEVERKSRREVYLKFWQWLPKENTWELVSRIDSPHSLDHGVAAGRILDLVADPSSLLFATIGEDGIARTWVTKTRKRDGVVVRGKDGVASKTWNCQTAISIGKSELDARNSTHNGCVAFSEDGSLLAAAFDGTNPGLLHLLDHDSGRIRLSKNGMYEGKIVKIGFLGQDLITLSNKILVYDLVLDEMRYSVKLGSSVTSLTLEQKVEMMHLAVDRKGRTFAVALPGRFDGPAIEDQRKQSLLSQYSEVAVFHQDRCEPLLKETFPTLITALIPAVGSDGYLVLDTAAEIRTILKKGSLPLTALAQSTSALQLDTNDEPSGDLLNLINNAPEEVEDTQLPTPPPNDDDENETPVVTQQQLSQVFDIGPAFALPPMEEMFYQVAGLFSSRPLAQSV